MNFFKRKKTKHRLGLKLSLLMLIIISAADVLTFSAAITIGMVTGGTNSTTDVIASVVSSIIIGFLLSFIIGIGKPDL